MIRNHVEKLSGNEWAFGSAAEEKGRLTELRSNGGAAQMGRKGEKERKLDEGETIRRETSSQLFPFLTELQITAEK